MPQPLEQLTAQVPGSTPELMQWITTQLAVGHTPAALQQSLLSTGWAEPLAQTAIAACLQAASPLATAAPPAMPGPDLHQQPGTIDVGDRHVQVLCSMEHPRLVLFGNLLSTPECEQLIADARPAMARSRTVATQTHGEEINPARTSNGMFYTRGQTPVVARLEARIAQLLRWPVVHGEGLQILNYLPGAEYQPHHDYFDPDKPGSAALLRRGGQRLGTLVIYLNDVPAGGGTYFPQSKLRIQPRQGNAVFFAYPTPEAHTLTLHAGDPVIQGEKWIATKWLRAQPFH